MQVGYKGYVLICSNADQIISIRKPDGWVVCTEKGFDEAKRTVDWLVTNVEVKWREEGDGFVAQIGELIAGVIRRKRRRGTIWEWHVSRGYSFLQGGTNRLKADAQRVAAGVLLRTVAESGFYSTPDKAA